MKNQKRGFTLIELLVVVLIIGILAAVAVPQYQKAVVKSRFAEAFANLKTLSEANKACLLAKGTSYCRMSELDVEVGTNVNQWGSNSENFFYQAGLIDGMVAQYLKEDVCLCLYNSGKFVVDQSGEDGCGLVEASMDYAQLLNVTDEADLDEDEEGYGCTCC